MPLEKLEISGFRGFSNKQNLEFSVPNGEPGSGLTIITGANNSGKSSIIECLKARGGHQSPSFTVGARNASVDIVELKYFINGKQESISSLKRGGSETKKDEVVQDFHIFVLPSRRAFNPFFGKSSHTRYNTYMIASVGRTRYCPSHDYTIIYGIPKRVALRELSKSSKSDLVDA